MAGAHLDSVLAGPGINDNGSGSAAILEVAEQIAKLNPENTVRFAWWGAEESGLVGSTNYVNGLSQAEKDRIALYLNFDMIGSPNYIQMVYDADQSSFPPPAGVPIPPGSTAIEDLFESFYTLRSEPYDDAQFTGRSDYQAFINNGIAAGGLFTGAEVRKTAEQAAIWGGTVGAQYDPCYHQACDTFANNNLHALEINSDAVATYLNFDMIGSPNYIIATYDADESTHDATATIPPGSAETEDVFTDYFDAIGQAHVDYPYSGRSDYQAFINNGVAAGGLSTGSDGVKTAAQAALFGGTAGVSYDPNYHSAGDDIDNVNLTALDIMSDAVAHATLSLARSTDLVTPGASGSSYTTTKVAAAAGLYGMLVVAVVAVFVAGLKVGRTPEHLGKKIGRQEITLVALYVLTTPAVVLVGTALSVVLPDGLAGQQEGGPHGLTEVLYAFASAGNNNGSAFAGLSAGTPYYNTLLGLAMLVGRFVPIALVLALAGRLASQRSVPPSAGTLPTHQPLFVGLLGTVALVVVGLTFVPVLSLGPVVESLS
jgi:Zn-dependent M28 family amino/carboxypeptidase